MLVAIICNKLGPLDTDPALPIVFTDFNVRWYHVYAMIAFVVANLWNFQLNRWWTFQSHKSASWVKEYFPFVAVGLMGQLVSFIVLTLLMHTGSPIHLPRSFFDGSTGFRTPFYWAQLISVLVAVPVTFLVNKVWTFKSVRGHRDADVVSTRPVNGAAQPTSTRASVEPAAPGAPVETSETLRASVELVETSEGPRTLVEPVETPRGSVEPVETSEGPRTLVEPVETPGASVEPVETSEGPRRSVEPVETSAGDPDPNDGTAR
ncbi:MAG: hypothetical protein GXX86_02005 [Propionibacterium sp.]|nr:hypothetical protein [Propionibacterium sp.]